MWEWFCNLIFAAIVWFYSWCGDWGLAIILVTLLFRLLIYPITRKQFKSTYKMQKLAPQINAIKEKYPDDRIRQNEEMQRIYKEAKFNPLAGCLPMILQMPIFMALFGVLGGLRERFANAVIFGHDNITLFGQNLTDLLSAAHPNGIVKFYEFTAEGTINKDTILLHDGVMSFYNLIPDLAVSPGHVFGELGVLAVLPYLVLVALFGVSMVIPLLTNKDQNSQSKMMMVVMCVVMVFFGWTAPAGVLLYWDISSLVGVAQQTGSKFIYQKEDELRAEEVIDVTPVRVDVERKEKKARPRKKG